MKTRGFVDASIIPETVHSSYVLAAVRARGLSLHRLSPTGQALRLTGHDVHVTVANLASLAMQDLEAPTRNELKARAAYVRNRKR